MHQQDSSDPTGVRQVSQQKNGAGNPGIPNATISARQRKADAAVEMRLGGATWSQIAEALGFPTPRAALVATERALQRRLDNPEDREAMRNLTGQRLQRLLRSTWSKAINPDNPDHLVAVSKALAVIDRHARLYGLDAPQEFVVNSPTTQQIEEWVAKVMQAQGVTAMENFSIIDAEEVDEDEEGPRAVSAG